MARQYTRESIRREFIAMLDERPLDEITVTDLVARCEINRKTFYYYYQDIYAVLSEIFESELEAVYARTRGTDAWEAGFTEPPAFMRRWLRPSPSIWNSPSITPTFSSVGSMSTAAAASPKSGQVARS